jgi:hypothetical protein
MESISPVISSGAIKSAPFSKLNQRFVPPSTVTLTEAEKKKEVYACDISGFHGNKYVDDSFLGCSAEYFCVSRPTFQRYILPPSSG